VTRLQRIDKFAPSQNPYWFDPSAVRIDGTMHRVPVMWFSRRNGRTVVTLGTYSLFSHRKQSASTPHEVIENADTRYGGDWTFRWDGHWLQDNSSAPSFVTTADRTHAQALLDACLNTSSGPRGWLGPYYKVAH